MERNNRQEEELEKLEQTALKFLIFKKNSRVLLRDTG